MGPGKIINPCSENWNGMSKCEGGKFCEMCRMKVLNGNLYTDEQLTLMLQQNGQVCVNIRPTRVMTKSIRVGIIAGIERKLKSLNLPRIAAIVGAVLLFASCCRQRIMGGWANACHLNNDRLYPMNEYPVQGAEINTDHAIHGVDHIVPDKKEN